MQLKPKGYFLSYNLFGYLIGVTKLQCLIDQVVVHALQKGTFEWFRRTKIYLAIFELKNSISFLILLKRAMIRG